MPEKNKTQEDQNLEQENQATTPPASDEKIEVNKSDLKALLDRVESLEKTNQSMSQDMINIKQNTDFKSSSRLRKDNQGNVIRTARLKTWRFDGGESDYIISWEMTKNHVEIDDRGNVKTDQRIKLVFHNNKHEAVEIPYVMLSRNASYAEGEIITKQEVVNEGIYYTLLMGDGEEIRVHERFIN